MQAKADLCKRSTDLVGFSALPEAALWFDVATSIMSQEGIPHQKPNVFSAAKCACCGKAETEAIRRCVRCKAVGYCGKDCQTKHWKMGHNIDSSGADKFRKIMKERSVLP
jgi:MYND finger